MGKHTTSFGLNRPIMSHGSTGTLRAAYSGFTTEPIAPWVCCVCRQAFGMLWGGICAKCADPTCARHLVGKSGQTYEQFLNTDSETFGSFTSEEPFLCTECFAASKDV